MSHSLSIDLDSTLVASASNSSSSSSQKLSVQSTSSPRVKLNTKSLYVSAIQGSQGRGQRFRITNAGTGTLKLDSKSISFTGSDADQFALVSGTLPRSLKPGAGASFTIALKASSSASLTRVLTATLNVKAAGSSTVLGKIAARGIATNGDGGLNEPSLARLIDLFQLSIDDGDSSPATTLLDIPNGASTDEISNASQFQKVDSSLPVQMDMLAVYLSDSTTVAGRVGYYTPGSPDTRQEVAAVYGYDAQNVKPTLDGATKFDPGSNAFSMWGEAPIFTDTAGKPRDIYGEDALNTWVTTGTQHKVRVYPYKVGGKAVANSYVVTFEDWDQQNDQNDYVMVLSNVKLVNAAKPEIGLIADDGQPEADRLVMNKVQNYSAQYHSTSHDTSTVTIVNSGSAALNISSVGISGADASDFTITAGGGAATIAAGATRDVTVQFVANSGAGIHTATLAIHSNDADEGTVNVALSAVWQQGAEVDQNGTPDEPTLQTIISTLGYRVNTGTPTQLENKGKTEAVGDEVLSTYWRAADTSLPVTVEEVGGWHQTDTASYVAWFERGHPWYYTADPRYNAATNGPENRLFKMSTSDTETFFPHLENSTTDYARASFSPGDKAFGMRIDGELSDDSLNIQQSGDLGGHHVRFYPVRDSSGNYVANTYLMVLDFSSINFDYNDHILLIHNLRPVDRNTGVEAIGSYSASNGATLDWNDVDDARSYRVYRSNKAAGTYSLIANNLEVSQYVDGTAKSGSTWYYRVVGVNSNGKETVPMNTFVKR